MRFAVVQATTPAAPGTQDYTDSNISSDWKGALFFASRGGANNTVTGDGIFSEGATDGTNQRLCGIGGPDGATSAGTMTVFNHSSTAACAGVGDNNSGTPNILGAYSSTLSNGVRVNYTTTTVQALMNALLVSGSDVQWSCVNQTLGTGSSPVTTTVTHGLASAPDVIFCVASLGSARVTHGFHHVSGATYGCVSYCNINGVNPTLVGGYVGDDCIGAQVSNTAVTYKLTVTNVGATTFDVVATGSTIEADVVTFISIKITNGVYKVGVATAPTGTGVAALVSGMSVTPDCVIAAMSRITNLNTFDSGDAGGVYGLGVVVNNGGSTQQACSSLSSDDNAATSIEKSYTSNTKCVAVMDAAGAIDIEAAHSSWDSGGVSLNWTNISSAVLIPYLAIGQGVSGPLWTQTQQHRTQRSTLLRM